MKLAIAPGSFDPIHNGHVEVLTRAATLFSGGLVIAVSHNPNKQYRIPLEDRVGILQEVFEWFDGVTVEPMAEGLIADFARSRGASTIVKGLRGPQDYEYEAPMATMNRGLGNVETVFLAGDPKNAHLSSSLVMEIARLGGDVADYVPKTVLNYLREHGLAEG